MFYRLHFVFFYVCYMCGVVATQVRLIYFFAVLCSIHEHLAHVSESE